MIVLIDDDSEFITKWRDRLEGSGEIVTYSHPVSFVSECIEEKIAVDRISVIVIDRLSRGFDAVQNDFPQKFKDTFPQFKGGIILCSGTISRLEDDKYGFSHVIPKRDEYIYVVRKYI